jgi:hypothetical protein
VDTVIDTIFEALKCRVDEDTPCLMVNVYRYFDKNIALLISGSGSSARFALL